MLISALICKMHNSLYIGVYSQGKEERLFGFEIQRCITNGIEQYYLVN